MDMKRTESENLEEETFWEPTADMNETVPVEKDEKSSANKKSIGHEILTTLIYIVAALCLALLLNKFVIQKVEVSMDSMYDTLEEGDQLFVEKVTNYFSDPKQSDIVVFEAPENSELDNGKYWIKRVIGVPGDTIQQKEDGVYVNGTKLTENYVDGDLGDPGIIEEPLTLGDDEYFLMGDNREVSKDCREVGPVSKERMMGRVCLRIWPLGKFGTIK